MQLEIKDADPVTFLFEGQTATQDRNRITEWITKLVSQGIRAVQTAAGSPSSKAHAQAQTKAQHAASQPVPKATAALAAAEEVGAATRCR